MFFGSGEVFHILLELGEVVFQKVIMKGIHLLFCRFGILR